MYTHTYTFIYIYIYIYIYIHLYIYIYIYISHSHVSHLVRTVKVGTSVGCSAAAGCLALSQDQRDAAYLARIQPHCGYQYQAPRCAIGVWSSHCYPWHHPVDIWLSNGYAVIDEWFTFTSIGYRLHDLLPIRG